MPERVPLPVLWLILALLATVGQLALATDAAPAPGASGVRQLIERGELEMRTDPEASKYDAQRALALLEHAPDSDLEVRARLLLCDYESERDVTAAQVQARAAASLLPRVKRQGLRAGVLLCEGSILETAGETPKAVERYRQAVTFALGAHDEEMLAEARFELGYLLGVRGDYANGLAELRASEKLFQSLHKPLHVLAALNSIAILDNRIGDYVQARGIYTRALQAQAAAGLLREQAVTLNNLGRADESLRDWEAARQAFSRCLEISTQIPYPRAQAYALRGLAAVANATGNPEGALGMLTRAETLQRQAPDARLHAQIQLERGSALHRLTRLAESVSALADAAQVFRQADARGELAATYSELAQVHAAAGNWHAAYDDETEAKSLSDQLLRSQIDLRFAALKVEFDTATKEQENAALVRQNEANARAIARDQSLRHLELAVIVLMVLAALLAAGSAWRMRVLALTDELTGVPNRRAVLTRLQTLLATSQLPCSILILDIDHFKHINDNHGHDAGDEVLKLVARRLQGAALPPAFFGRLGGEEFLIVLPATPLVAARSAAQGLCERIFATDISGSIGRRRITASIGVATGTPGSDTPSTLLRRADTALYAAKHGGRNCVRTEPPLDEDHPNAA
jgi:diguanylate cyclase (GGDEF)-like protein